MNIFKIFDTIEEIVFSSQRLPWPFAQWSIINRQHFLRMLDKMRHSVPEEMKHAREVTREVDRLLAEAHDRAESVISDARTQASARLETAREERERLINATEVVQTARTRATEIEEAARVQARDLEKATRQRCQEIRERAEEEARRVVVAARAEADRCEQELDDWGVRRLAELEREVDRALGVIRKQRRQIEESRAQDDRDLSTVEMPAADLPAVPGTASPLNLPTPPPPPGPALAPASPPVGGSD